MNLDVILLLVVGRLTVVCILKLCFFLGWDSKLYNDATGAMAVVVCNANMLLNSWYRLDIHGIYKGIFILIYLKFK